MERRDQLFAHYSEGSSEYVVVVVKEIDFEF